jgi:hemerythrin
MTAHRTGDKPGVLWQEMRAAHGYDLVNLLTEIRDSQCAMKKRMDGIEESMKEHINLAFAGGDPAGHRRAHELIISNIEEKRRLRVAIQEKTISGLIWAAVLWLALAVWSQIKISLGLPPN